MKIAREWFAAIDEEDDIAPSYRIIEKYGSYKVVAWGISYEEATKEIRAHKSSTESPKSVLTRLATNYHYTTNLTTSPHEGSYEDCKWPYCSDARKALALL